MQVNNMVHFELHGSGGCLGYNDYFILLVFNYIFAAHYNTLFVLGVCVCVCACVRACVRACSCICVNFSECISRFYFALFYCYCMETELDATYKSIL